jgi:hypothetical protein
MREPPEAIQERFGPLAPELLPTDRDPELDHWLVACRIAIGGSYDAIGPAVVLVVGDAEIPQRLD